MELILYHLPYLAVAILLAQSLNIAWRSGMYSFGHHGFFGIGAYAAVFCVQLMDGGGLRDELAYLGFKGVYTLTAAFLCSALVAGIAGYLVSLIAERLSSDYFSVATLMFAEIIRRGCNSWEGVGAAHGVSLPYFVYERGGDYTYSFYAFYGAVGLGLVLLTHWSLHWLNHTFMGLHMRAIHDDRLGAMSSGINTVLVERTAFTISAAVAGIAGASFAFYSSSIVPSDFDFNNGLLIILYVVLGARSIARCTLATVGVYVFYEAAKLRMFGILGEGVGEQIAQSKEILLALLLIFTAFLSPTNRLPSLLRKV